MKNIKVRVIPNSKYDKVTEGNGMLKVYVKAPPIDGKANKQLVKILADYYKVKKNEVRIISGLKSRKKYIEIKT